MKYDSFSPLNLWKCKGQRNIWCYFWCGYKLLKVLLTTKIGVNFMYYLRCFPWQPFLPAERRAFSKMTTSITHILRFLEENVASSTFWDKETHFGFAICCKFWCTRKNNSAVVPGNGQWACIFIENIVNG